MLYCAHGLIKSPAPRTERERYARGSGGDLVRALLTRSPAREFNPATSSRQVQILTGRAALGAKSNVGGRQDSRAEWRVFGSTSDVSEWPIVSQKLVK